MLVAFLKRHSTRFQMFTGVHELRKATALTQAREHERLKQEVRASCPDNVAACGYKVYSQTDEDGIIEEIFRRIGGNRTFMEIGVQTGVECNSLLLLLKGWRGAWIEGNEAYCDIIRRELGGDRFASRFALIHSFVRQDNIKSLYDRVCELVGTEDLDFFSLDIDGNDLHVMDVLLAANARPGVVCVEYHAKFPPPVSLTIRYADDHAWDETDYMGSSLQAFVDLFERYGYRLATCNIPGINAFFVRDDLAHHFTAVTPEQLYQPYRFYLSPIAVGQPPTLRYLRDALNPQR